MAVPNFAGLVKGLISGDSFLTQIFAYGAANQILQALLAPYLQQVQNDVWTKAPVVPISPADAADMVIRTILTPGEGATEAAMSGINADRFAKLVLDTGEPPGLEQVLEWARRGYAPFTDDGPGKPSVPEAVRTSRIRNEWLDVIIKGQWLPLTVSDAVNAWIRGQIDEPTAKTALAANGIRDPEATTLYNTAGRPPAPGQLIDMVNRGFIPLKGRGPLVLSLEQGIIEGDLKDKWEPIFEQFIVKLPGIFEIRLMQQQGAISAQQAYKLYREEGLADDVAKSATAAAAVSKAAKAKEISQATVEQLYSDQIISRQDALADLQSLGYDATEGDYLLQAYDLKRQAAAITAAVTNIRTRYLAKRLDEAAVKTLLGDLKFSDDRIQALLEVWDIELQAQVRVLTAAEILDAVEYSIATTDWAIGELENLGYSARDAWTKVSIKLKSPAPNPPDGIPPAPAPAPTAAAAP